MILITREDPGPAVLQIELQDTQPRRMARGMVQIQALSDLDVRAVERHPVDVEGEVVREIDAEIGFCGDAVEGVFELEFVHVDGYVFAFEILQPAGVVEV